MNSAVRERYTKENFETITDAYRKLFPNVNSALANYWDFSRSRPWSCLTRDFWQDDWLAFRAFDAEVPNARGSTPQELGKALKDLACKHKAGFSLGISPWTDDLLLKTFDVSKCSVVIMVGHDWYPIVERDMTNATPPLHRDSVHKNPVYGAAMPNTNRIVLFLNLYPDFRAPGADTMGSLGNYDAWVQGLEAVVESIRRNYEIKGILSWGKYVWEAIRPRLGGEWKELSVTKAVDRQYQIGQPHALDFGGERVSYFGFAHPSSSNFRRQEHRAAYQRAMASLA